MAKRKRKSSGRKPGGMPVGRLVLLAIIILEALWLAGFVRGTGSWFPPGLGSRAGSGETVVWSEEKEEQLGSLLIDKALAQEGSRGASEEPPRPE